MGFEMTKYGGGGDTTISYVKKVNGSSFSYCGKFATLAPCPGCGEAWTKLLLDGKEWCPVCGREGSKAHMRRLSRVIPKLTQLPTAGYFVIEFPLDYRKLGQGGIYPDIDVKGWCRKKSDLRETTKDIISVFKGVRIHTRDGANHYKGGYFDRGLLRWHWFGDKYPGKYNPHANVIVEGNIINYYKLAEIKSALRAKLNCPKLIVHYSYFDDPGKIYHKGKYITRPTFLKKEWDEYMAAEIWGFRNMRSWGKWDGPNTWVVDKKISSDLSDMLAVKSLHSGKCPHCGTSLKWEKPIPSLFIAWLGRELAGSGYYEISAKDMRAGPMGALT